MDLRASAKGEQCMIRVPTVCNYDSQTTVWCHVRMIGISGAGLKVPDLLGAYGCFKCHEAVDGRAKTPYSRSELRLMLLEGAMRTLNKLIKRGQVTW